MTYSMKERLSNTLASLVDARQERDAAHAALDKSNEAINKYLAERQSLVVALNRAEGTVCECWNAVDTQGPRATDGSTLPDEIRGLVAEVARLREERDEANAVLPALRDTLGLCDKAMWEHVAYHARLHKADWGEMVAERGELVQRAFLAESDRDALRAVLRDVLPVLEQVEWSGEACPVPTCPSCYGNREDGHGIIDKDEGCRLADAIQALRAALGKDGE